MITRRNRRCDRRSIPHPQWRVTFVSSLLLVAGFLFPARAFQSETDAFLDSPDAAKAVDARSLLESAWLSRPDATQFSAHVKMRKRGTGAIFHNDGNMATTEADIFWGPTSFETEGTTLVSNPTAGTRGEPRAFRKRVAPDRVEQPGLPDDPDDPPPVVIAPGNDRALDEMRFSARFGGAMFGYLPDNGRTNLLRALSRYENLEKAVKPSDLGASGKIISIRGEGKYGILGVWLDPEREMAPVRFFHHKEADDLVDKRPLSELSGIHYDPKVVILERIVEINSLERRNGDWFPVKGTMTLVETFDIKWGENSLLHEYDLDEVRRGEHATHVFSASRPMFDQGTMVRDLRRPGVTYVFRNGEIRPWVDPVHVQQADDALKELKFGRGAAVIDGARVLRQSNRNVQPYCGVFCAYAWLAMRKGGRGESAVHVEQLLKPKYVGSAEGSSLGELAAALTNFGVPGVSVYSDLTIDSLRRAAGPMILFVRGSTSSEKPDHISC